MTTNRRKPRTGVGCCLVLLLLGAAGCAPPEWTEPTPSSNKSHNSRLISFSVDPVTLSPEFSADTTNYDGGVCSATTFTITATPEDSKTTLTYSVSGGTRVPMEPGVPVTIELVYQLGYVSIYVQALAEDGSDSDYGVSFSR